MMVGRQFPSFQDWYPAVRTVDFQERSRIIRYSQESIGDLLRHESGMTQACGRIPFQKRGICFPKNGNKIHLSSTGKYIYTFMVDRSSQLG